MADYFSQCVVSPMLPIAAISEAEKLVLRAVFESEVDGDELYLFCEDGRRLSIDLALAEIRDALSMTASPSAATQLLAEALAKASDGEEMVEIEVDDAWLDILQEIVRREDSLSFVAVETAFTCTKMRPDGFGGGAIVITADAIDSMSISQFIDETLAARVAAVRVPE